MKELSIEEKAKAYDEAIKIAREINNEQQAQPFNVMTKVFPELKENKDETIRNQLRDFFKNHIDSVYEEIDDNNDVLAWIEKQGEQINLPQFTFDDVLALQCAMENIKKVQEDKDLYEKLKDLHGRVYDAYHFEKQSKQKATIEMKSAEESLGIDSNTYNKIVDECIYGEQKPANKVEPKFKIGDNIEPIDSCLGSPLTIYKICDGFYETNQGTLDFEFENNWRLIEQKPACSEEDEVKINRILACLENLNVADNDILLKDVDWLKSLKDRVGCEVNCTTTKEWKPSDEQLNNILDVLSFDNCTPKRRELLESLYHDLKKLM